MTLALSALLGVGELQPATEQRTADAPSPTSDAPARTGSPSTDTPTRVEIPELGVDSSLIELDLDDQGRLEVPDDGDQAGWYARGPRPGADGPAVLTGHVDSPEGRGVFWDLAELRPGDEILVERKQEDDVRFHVDRVEQWPKDDFPTDEVYREADGPELRVITCGGEFEREERSYRDNIIVFASLR